MRFSVLAAALAELLLVSSVSASLSPALPKLPQQPAEKYDFDLQTGRVVQAAAPYYDTKVTPGYFQQLIDHNNPSLGTFTQRYWWNADNYGGPGWPIVLNAPGEENADNYTWYATNQTLPGLFAQSTGGAAIVLEHRFWGGSSPYQNITTDKLQLLNVDMAIADLIYFANNVKLPFDPTTSSRPNLAPWVLTGCSYPGALTAWTNALAPGTFWAYHCSSAVVEVIPTFWEYFSGIKSAMPQNCTTDLTLAISQVDQVLSNGTAQQRQQLKSTFGLGDLQHDDDFASALATTLFSWQGQEFYSKYATLFLMCDYIENVWPGSGNPTPGANGVGESKAMNGFVKFIREVQNPNCGGTVVSCYDTYDLQQYADTSVNNTNQRQWQWLLCNEPLEFWEEWAPGSNLGILSEYAGYTPRQCDDYFPEVNGMTYGLKAGRTGAQLNAKTGGWNNVNTTNLLWVNGEYDPWRAATVSSDIRPGGPLQSTPEAPVWVIPKAAHCNDMVVANAYANADVARIMQAEVAQISIWVNNFWAQQGRKAKPAREFGNATNSTVAPITSKTRPY